MNGRTIFLSVLIFVLWGCSEAKRPPAAVSQELSTADRLEVTNRGYGFGSTIAGAEVNDLAKAVTSAKRKTSGADLDWMSARIWNVEFCAGTNHLAAIPISCGVFKLQGVEYSDGTGVVEALWRKLEEHRIR
jgi:hypothetical protein